MHNLIKRLIVWYLLKYCNAVFKYNDKVVRILSKDFYENEVCEYLNAVARARFNERNGR